MSVGSTTAHTGDEDDRVTCKSCRHLRPGRCTNAQRALLSRRNQHAEVGAEFAALKQRCHGFAPVEAKR